MKTAGSRSTKRPKRVRIIAVICAAMALAASACTTLVGVTDIAFTDVGAVSSDASRGSSSAQESGADSGTDATIEAGGDGSAGNDGGLDAPSADGGSEAGECTAPETKCMDSAVATCTANGTYGAAVPCSSSTCAMGRCTGSCEAGARECSGSSAAQTCASGTWGTPVPCTNQTCVPATAMCTGVCAPGQTHPIACGNCGTNAQTCSASGAWQDATCTGQGCVPTATQSCNTYGMQTCSSSCAWGACSCPSTPVCVPNASQCSSNGVQTCNACGQWGSAVACSASTPNCIGGSCTSAPTSQSASTPGTCTVQTYASGIPSGADYVNPTIYYATDCAGPFPGVVVIPAFTATQSSVGQWGPFLASHGFVVMLIDTASGGTANTGIQAPARATALIEAVATLQGENTRSGSPLAGKVDTGLIAVMGHSMGGGGTLIAANAHPELKAAIGLCPWNPGGTYPNDTVPSVVFAGSADTLVPPSQAMPEYTSIPTTTAKIYAEFDGGTNFVATTPTGGAATDLVVARIGLSWLEVNLVGDSRYQQFLVKDATMSNWDMKP